jgi:predicted MFS family arabinose efflux permease
VRHVRLGAVVGRLLQRLVRLLLGSESDPALRPLLPVQLLSTLGFSTFWTYMPIWAVKELGADASDVGILFLISAPVGVVSGFAGGRLSDRLGRKPLIVFSVAGETCVVLSLLSVGHDVVLGFAIVVVGWAVSAPWQSAGQALIADLVPSDRRESAYATVRVINNLGIVLGPPVGGLLLLLGGWETLITGAAAVGAIACATAIVLLPRTAAFVHEETESRGSVGVIVRDRPFLLLLLSTVLAYIVYVAFETVLPIVAVESLGYNASTWGFLVILNPALVTLFQLRLTRATQDVPAPAKLAAAIPMMGFPFFLLLVSGSVPVVLFVLLVFVLGEMLWVPTSQALAARMAPADMRGAYMGAYGGSGTVGWMISPFVGLQLRGASGDAAMWTFFAATSLAGAMAGVAASRRIPESELGAAVAGDRTEPARELG